MKNYGHFDEHGRYVVTNPWTPEPWLHYMIRPGQPGTSTFASACTYSGGGFDVKGTHENTFVDTRLHLNDSDDRGRYVYIKDLDSGELWSNFWQPVRNPRQAFTSTLGFGYIEALASLDGIDVKTTMFVPEDFDGWIQDIVIHNTSSRLRTLELYPYLPVHMGNALQRLLAGDNDAMFGGASLDPELRGIVFRRHHGIAAEDRPELINGMLGNVALYHSSLNPSDGIEYDSCDEGFLGSRFHGMASPGAIELGKLRNTDTAHLRRGCGVFRHSLSLQAGQSIRFALLFAAGSTSNYYLGAKSELKALVERVASESERDAMLEAIKKNWSSFMGSLRLEGPEAEFNRAFPWLQYQCRIVYALNRMKSRFHTGYEYGWGFRDILQDILFVLPYDPRGVREALAFIATQMFSDGRTYHNFFIDQPGNKSVEASDDPLWLAAAVVQYCKETADYRFLDERVAYADEKEGLKALDSSILEHCVAGLDRVWSDRSDRDLPWLKDCDWNDDLNENREDGLWKKRYESVMVAQQLYRGLVDTAELFERSGRRIDLAPEYRRRAGLVKKALLAHALDSEGYYKRALAAGRDGARDLGSSADGQGSMFLEPQLFAILGGLCQGLPPGVPASADTLLGCVEKRLDSDFGAMLCFPYFSDLAQGRGLPTRSWNIEKEPPGMKENGGIFMHLNAWLVQAYCVAGRGKAATALYRKTLPERMAGDADRYRCEPYVYPEYVRGKDSPGHGRGGHTWLTGTAPTMHTALVEYIFGIKADYSGLRLDPCFDPNWKELRARRHFRGAWYEITYTNPEGFERGIKTASIDGMPLEPNPDGSCTLPPGEPGRIYTVKALLGA